MSLCSPEDFLVKVCGLTDPRDLEAAVEAGANAVGLNFYPPSPRYISIEQARRLLARLRSLAGTSVAAIGVVVLKGGRREWPRGLEPILAELDGVQVHGPQVPDEIPPFPGRILVAVTPETMDRFPHQEVIVDTSWGKGVKADWQSLRAMDRTFVLAGGLDATNVRQALETLHPVGVDVCSGVEATPGRKDPAKLRAFMEEVEKYLKERELGIRS